MLELAFLYDEVDEQKTPFSSFYDMIKLDPEFQLLWISDDL